MASPFIAEIVMFGGNFAPRSWAFCDGQLLAISQNQALFSLLGTTYGGDGRTTFALPDLRGRLPMHPGSGSGLSNRRLGEKGGVENVTLNTTEVPSHTHTAVSTANAVTPAGNSNDAVNNFWADDAGVASGTYHSGPANVSMNAAAVSTTVANAGGNQAHTNVQPFQCVNFIIALQGIYPSRN
ncbi:MAG: phage tail protein [Gammaproteobacteria bacterium]|nr:phage tail protein [Gammaproteobacteria bacterium]